MKPLVLALVLASAASPAAARDGFAVDDLTIARDSNARAARYDWWLSGDGEVRLAETQCPMCRAFQRLDYHFKVEGDVVARIAALLPFDLVEAATLAPCTLPQAETAWARPVRVSGPDRNGLSQSHSFFDRCESAELTALRSRLEAATLALVSEIERRSIQPEAK